jgi:uncharacterized cupin superfamily protein
MRCENVFSVALASDDDDPPGYHAEYLKLGPLLGATRMGASVYELPPGQSICPYHYEYGEEEWLLVLGGHPRVRHPGGEEHLDPGGITCFPVGPEGAHKVTNDSDDEVVRVLMISTRVEPNVAVYPDSDKVGIYPGGNAERLMVERSSGVDYWHGET